MYPFLFSTVGLNEGPPLRSRSLRTTIRCVQRAALSRVNTQKAAGSTRTLESKPRGLLGPDPLFTKTELRSERYNAYRKKGRYTSERQMWNDELEDSFQLGVFTYDSNDLDSSFELPQPCEQYQILAERRHPATPGYVERLKARYTEGTST